MARGCSRLAVALGVRPELIIIELARLTARVKGARLPELRSVYAEAFAYVSFRYVMIRTLLPGTSTLCVSRAEILLKLFTTLRSKHGYTAD